MHSTSVRESLIESPVILSSSKPQNIVSTSANSFEYPAILSLPKHCFVCFWWRRRLRTLQFYSPPSHKASAATQSACLRILQSPFQAGNSSAHQKNLVWVPCSFFFSKTSGSVAARVWVPCNFIFFQAQQWQWKTWYLVWVPCNFILCQTYTVHELQTMLVWVPCNFTFLQAFKMLKSCGSSVWVPCNFIFFQTKDPGL